MTKCLSSLRHVWHEKWDRHEKYGSCYAVVCLLCVCVLTVSSDIGLNSILFEALSLPI